MKIKQKLFDKNRIKKIKSGIAKWIKMLYNIIYKYVIN